MPSQWSTRKCVPLSNNGYINNKKPAIAADNKIGCFLICSLTIQWVQFQIVSQQVSFLSIWLFSGEKFKEKHFLKCYLNLRQNQFTGTIDLTQLPQSMKELDVGYNQISGSLHLNQLPEAMYEIKLRKNSFTGSLVAANLPPRLKLLDVRHNLFNSIAVVDAQTEAEVKLRENNVTSVVDANGNKNTCRKVLYRA